MNYELLNQDIQFLPGVGPNRKKMLSQELNITTVGDLLQYYPIVMSIGAGCTALAN